MLRRAVRHIGVISRTRSDRLGPRSRPDRSGSSATLYLGTSPFQLAVSAHLVWLVPIFVVVLSFGTAIVVGRELLHRSAGTSIASDSAGSSWIPSAAVTSGRRPAAGDTFLAGNVLQRTRNPHRDCRRVPFALDKTPRLNLEPLAKQKYVKGCLPHAAPQRLAVVASGSFLSVCHRYHDATERYGRQASPIFDTRVASGLLRNR